MVTNISTQPLVKPLYQTEPDLYVCKATVTDVGTTTIKGTEYFWIRLNETIFHPHGGGQLSDKGTINGMPVVFVNKNKLEKNDHNLIEIEHCFKNNPELKVGDEVQLKVDEGNRYDNSLWHTAAHVIDYAVVMAFPNLEGYSGQCYPNRSFMKFVLKSGDWPEKSDVKQKVNASIEEITKLPLKIVVVDGIRKLAIGDHHIPCGGTHIHSLGEITSCSVYKVTLEKRTYLKVSFKVETRKTGSK